VSAARARPKLIAQARTTKFQLTTDVGTQKVSLAFSLELAAIKPTTDTHALAIQSLPTRVTYACAIQCYFSTDACPRKSYRTFDLKSFVTCYVSIYGQSITMKGDTVGRRKVRSGQAKCCSDMRRRTLNIFDVTIV
jgi:hypothetical protein